LSYYDYFATDAGLHHLITNELRFDEKYGVTVFADAHEFLRELKTIAG